MGIYLKNLVYAVGVVYHGEKMNGRVNNQTRFSRYKDNNVLDGQRKQRPGKQRKGTCSIINPPGGQGQGPIIPTQIIPAQIIEGNPEIINYTLNYKSRFTFNTVDERRQSIQRTCFHGQIRFKNDLVMLPASFVAFDDLNNGIQTCCAHRIMAYKLVEPDDNDWVGWQNTIIHHVNDFITALQYFARIVLGFGGNDIFIKGLMGTELVEPGRRLLLILSHPFLEVNAQRIMERFLNIYIGLANDTTASDLKKSNRWRNV